MDPTRPVVAYVHGIHARPLDSNRRRYLRLVIHPDTEHLVAVGNAHNRKGEA